MVKADRCSAVANRPENRYFAASFDGSVQVERFEAIAITGHPMRLAAIAAKDESAKLTLLPATGVMRGTPSEIKHRPGISGNISPAVAERIPSGVFVERKRHAVDRQIIHPARARAIPGFHHGQEPEMGDRNS